MARTIAVGPAGKRLSRLREHAKNNLGVIMTNDMGKAQTYRSEDLELYDRYYESSQYDHLSKWDDACDQSNEAYVPVRKRKPRIIYNLPKVLVDKITSKLVGKSVFPRFSVEDDPDDTAFFAVVQKASGFRRNLIEPIRRALVSGSCFVRFYFVDGNLQMEWANSKWCWPKFDAVGELDEIEIKYVFDDWDDINQTTMQPRQKWYRIVLSKMADIEYDNPDYKEGVKPTFQEASRADHGLGWVQGEWLATAKDKFCPDGPSVFGEIIDFIDDINYSLSQSSQAVQYNQEPQLALNNMDEDEIDNLIRSSQKAWNLGREGKAEFLENQMDGVEKAADNRDHNRMLLLEVVRVILHDPDKMNDAQSGKALETLNAPLVELVDEFRAILEPHLIRLLLKMGLSALHLNATGLETSIETPDGYMPSSLDLTADWPAIFPPTLDDIKAMADIATSVTTAKVMSRETMTKWLAPVFGIDDIEEELSKLESEPDLNPFGGGFGDSGGGQ